MPSLGFRFSLFAPDVCAGGGNGPDIESIYNIALRANTSLASSVWISYLNPSELFPSRVFPFFDLSSNRTRSVFYINPELSLPRSFL